MIIGAGNAQESNHPGGKAVIRALGYDCFFRDMLSGEVCGCLGEETIYDLQAKEV